MLHMNPIFEAIHIKITFINPGVPKLWTSTFLMYFGVLNLDSGNQIWKFKYKCFGKFSGFEFNKYHIFWTLKSLGTTALIHCQN